MFETIKNILEEAVYAPSGENTQPWRFEVRDDVLFVHNIPDKDNPIFNYKQYGAYIAHGALLENIRLLASEYGYNVAWNVFPNGMDNTCVARVSFVAQEKKIEPLVSCIKKRSTNRKHYRNEALTDEAKAVLLAAANSIDGVKALIIEDQEERDTIANAVCVTERIMLENDSLHDAFFERIRWTAEEEEREKEGMYLKTMELKPPQQFVFSLLKKPFFLRIARKIGLPTVISKENSELYKTGAGLLVFYMKESPEQYISLGQALQRAWLAITQRGLWAHPIAGVLYLGQSLSGPGKEVFSDVHQDVIRQACDMIENIVSPPVGEKTVMILRVGASAPPSAGSSKRGPVIEQRS